MASSFKGKDGQEWTTDLDALKIIEIRAECDPEFLLGPGGQEEATIERLQDPVLLCRVIYLLCRKQREARETNEEDFYLKVIGDGDAIQAATEAVIAAIVAFSRPWKRELLRATAAKNEKIQELGTAKAIGKINDPALEARIVTEMEREMDAQIEKILNPSSSACDSLALSVSTPPA